MGFCESCHLYLRWGNKTVLSAKRFLGINTEERENTDYY